MISQSSKVKKSKKWRIELPSDEDSDDSSEMLIIPCDEDSGHSSEILIIHDDYGNKSFLRWNLSQVNEDNKNVCDFIVVLLTSTEMW